ncbi:Fatty acid hydroxylase [Moelleriella libera RCEF 2490]|uniref:Fatty acid hydroxylase n=1 Tax=Moelleriella libera RCEF 2490 TaxID=1081109 RepID=A0A168BIG6_9HYPO|nr:Fatty acid hydroxylase [Moelleriella libera RCEF 2490]
MATPNGSLSTKGSFKSTWRFGDKRSWGVGHWILYLANGFPIDVSKPVPKHAKTDKIPILSQLSQNIWVALHALPVFFIHQALLHFSGGQGLHPLSVFFLYFNAFNLILIRMTHALRSLGHTWGYLDGDVHDRDGIPDEGVGKITASIFKGTGGRIAMLVLLTYDRAAGQPPLDVVSSWRWWAGVALKLGLYSVVLDFWFYWYHRLMHDVPWLWKFHRTHHLTKHPNQLMTAFADKEQEFFDLLGVPLLTYLSLWGLGLKLDFFEWWLCLQFIVFSEVTGHSGVRLHAAGISPLHPILRYFDVELVVEDHDLHHRKGWRKSHNYGKQTRLWDRVFGTCLDRIESAPDNVDWKTIAYVPFF